MVGSLEVLMSVENALVTDNARDRTVARLREACVDGRLSVEEFTQRMEVAYAARTSAEFTSALEGLGPTQSGPRRLRRAPLWTVATMGDAERTGRWRLSGRTNALAFMGNCVLDLRRAQIDGGEALINAIAFMGNVRVIVPEGAEVDLDGWALMGSRKCRVLDVQPHGDAPYVRVWALALMGEVEVESRP